MHQILFKFGPLTIYSYGFMLCIAVLVALHLLMREAYRQCYDRDTILDLGMTILLSGIAGARILFILLNIEFFIENPKEIFMLNHGGLSILGAMLSATIALSIFIKKKKLHFFKTVDLVIPFIALGQSIGRIGCFFNGCCYGIASKYGIYFPVHNAILIPTQLISSILLLMLFIFLRVQQQRPHYSGGIFVNYILYYSILRFFIEFIRADSPKHFFALTLYQYLCIVIFVSGLILSLVLKWKNKTSQ